MCLARLYVSCNWRNSIGLFRNVNDPASYEKIGPVIKSNVMVFKVQLTPFLVFVSNYLSYNFKHFC